MTFPKHDDYTSPDDKQNTGKQIIKRGLGKEQPPKGK
jgi:hypothetical protein